MATKGAPAEEPGRTASNSGLAARAPDPREMPSADALSQLRLGHLNMIQFVVGRLAGSSASAKTFSATLAAAAVAVTFTDKLAVLLWIPAVAVALLGLLDAYYLAQEKAFRDRYEEVAARPLVEATNLSIKRPPLRFLEALRSFSVWGFYAPQLAVVAYLLAASKGWL